MTDHDEMDVDIPNLGGLFASSSTLNIVGLDLDTLNHNMKRSSKSYQWQLLIDSNPGDEGWLRLFSDVLMRLTMELATTDMKSKFIASPNLNHSYDLVKSFNKEEVEQWKAGTRSGVERDDWADLIKHRTYISDYYYRMVGSRLIATTAKLRNRKVSNVAPGVPIEYSAPRFFPFHSATMLTSRSSFVLA
jgi:hypothetical protein